MFTGIIETLGTIQEIEKDKDNYHFTINSSISKDLKIDQSVAHNGVCLTVVALNENTHTVTAIKETIEKSNLSDLIKGDSVNIERAMKLSDRLDGHIVQGHVDQTGTCKLIEDSNGSWYFSFEYDDKLNNLTIEKGSITVNGVSLTVVNSKKNEFSVAIIPYTFEFTTFKHFRVGTKVNLEFDVIGKYVSRLYSMRR